MDFSWVMAGPMATKILGGLGAEVVKVESSTRPEFAVRDGMFAIVNNNKKSCTVNLRSPAGQKLLRSLMMKSDVVVENFSSGVLDKYGLAYDDLKADAPSLVFVSASGLGRAGPQKDMLAYGSLLQGYSGRVGLIGDPNPYLEAIGIVPAWTDPVTAMWEVLAILSALHHRSQTGEGSFIDLSMLESTVALLPEAIIRAGLDLPDGEAASGTERGAAPSGCFQCAGDDEWLALSIRSDGQWHQLCDVLGWNHDGKWEVYADTDQRLKSKPQLDLAVSQVLRERNARMLEAELAKRGVPAARSQSIADLTQNPTLKERHVFEFGADGAHMGTVPWMVEGGWHGEYAETPVLGADNDYIFGDLLGLTKDEMLDLVERGVIA